MENKRSGKLEKWKEIASYTIRGWMLNDNWAHAEITVGLRAKIVYSSGESEKMLNVKLKKKKTESKPCGVCGSVQLYLYIELIFILLRW